MNRNRHLPFGAKHSKQMLVRKNKHDDVRTFCEEKEKKKNKNKQKKKKDVLKQIESKKFLSVS